MYTYSKTLEPPPIPIITVFGRFGGMDLWVLAAASSPQCITHSAPWLAHLENVVCLVFSKCQCYSGRV